MSQDAIRKLDDEGKLPSFRTEGNQRRWFYENVWSYAQYGVINNRRPVALKYHTWRKPPSFLRMIGEHNRLEEVVVEYPNYIPCTTQKANELIVRMTKENWTKYLSVVLLDPSVDINLKHKICEGENGNWIIPYASIEDAIKPYHCDDEKLIIWMEDIHPRDKSFSLHKKGCPYLIKFDYFEVVDKIPVQKCVYYEPADEVL